MAGEWIPIDIGLGLKPEIQELVDLTGQTVETVVYRLIQVWGWVSINTADGTIREERRGEFPPPPPPRARDRETGTRAEEIVLAWGIAAKASGGKLAPFQAKKPPAAIWDRFDDGSWADQALAAIERLPRCRYFDSPPTLEQLCGVKGGVTFVERVLAGAYDGPKNAKAEADGRPTTQAAVDRFKKRDPARDAMVREYREAKQARKAATA